MEKQSSKPEIAPQKRGIKFAPAIGDWTIYKPPRVLVKKVKTGLYGFDRLSKEELNEFLLIHYNFIKGLLKRLKIDLGMSVELFSVSVEQTTFLNFLRTLTNSVVQGKIKIPNIHDPILLFFDLAQANSLINYALGSQDLENINRALTDAENKVFTTTISEYLPKLSDAFEKSIKNLSYEIVNSPDVVIDSSINPSLTLASFSAEISLADNPPSKIVFSYPGNTLKILLAKYRTQRQAKPLNFARIPSSLLSKIKTKALISLGDTLITTNDIRQLESGDVVSLETSINAPISLLIGKEIKLFAQPGIKSKKHAVRIVGFEEKEIELPKPELEATPKEEEPIEEPTETFKTEEPEFSDESNIQDEESADLSDSTQEQEEETLHDEFEEENEEEGIEEEEEEKEEEETDVNVDESEEIDEEEFSDEDFSDEELSDDEFSEDLSSETQDAEEEEFPDENFEDDDKEA